MRPEGHADELGVTDRDLAVARGGVTVLEGVAFRWPRARRWSCAGRTGRARPRFCARSRGLQPPLAGEVSVPPDSVAYAAHADGLKATLTVAENLRFWAAIYGSRRRRRRRWTAMDLARLARPAGAASCRPGRSGGWALRGCW